MKPGSQAPVEAMFIILLLMSEVLASFTHLFQQKINNNNNVTSKKM